MADAENSWRENRIYRLLSVSDRHLTAPRVSWSLGSLRRFRFSSKAISKGKHTTPRSDVAAPAAGLVTRRETVTTITNVTVSVLTTVNVTVGENLVIVALTDDLKVSIVLDIRYTVEILLSVDTQLEIVVVEVIDCVLVTVV